MLKYVIITFMVLSSAINAFCEDGYYYANGAQVPLTISDSKIVIGFRDAGFGLFEELYAAYSGIIDTIPPEYIIDYFYVFCVYPGTNIENLLQELNQDTTILLAQNAFVNDMGGIEAFADQIAVKRSASLTQAEYDSLLDSYNVVEIDSSWTREDVRYLKVGEDASMTVLQTANRLYEEESIIFSHPQFFYKTFELFDMPDDSFFIHQWYYYNPYEFEDEYGEIFEGKDIAATTAWDITKGNEDIIIAVLDQGITNHPDFPVGALIDTIDIVGEFWDKPQMDSNCAITKCDSCGHGYAVSGEIIAAHNDKGIAGLAPDCM